jgi:hypothetical protein
MSQRQQRHKTPNLTGKTSSNKPRKKLRPRLMMENKRLRQKSMKEKRKRIDYLLLFFSTR